MKFLIQRVKSAQVTVENEIVGEIGQGLLIFVGIDKSDTEDVIDYLVNKVVNLRIFENEDKKFDQTLDEVNASVLLVPQFTLCSKCENGRRPDFFSAAAPIVAKKLFDYVEYVFKENKVKIATGQFGAYMQVKLENDGPATFMIEK